MPFIEPRRYRETVPTRPVDRGRTRGRVEQPVMDCHYARLCRLVARALTMLNGSSITGERKLLVAVAPGLRLRPAK
jgi:hypothetical protein